MSAGLHTVEAQRRLCHYDELNYFFSMPTETSIPDAEDLKSRVRELRRFL
jgi:hypothetical protein